MPSYLIAIIVFVLAKWLYSVYKADATIKHEQQTKPISNPDDGIPVFYPGMNELVIARVQSFLENKCLQYSYNEQGKCFSIPYSTHDEPSSNYSLYIIIEAYFICFFTVLYQDVPLNKSSELLELIARINTHLNVGHLHFEHEHCSVSLEQKVPLFEVKLSNDFLELYLDSLNSGHTYFKPLIKKVILEDEIPLIAMLDFEFNYKPFGKPNI